MPGAAAGTQAKSNREGRMTMQRTSARRIGRNYGPVGGRRHTIAFVAAALLIALPVSANGQTGQATTPAVSPAPALSAPATGTAPGALSQPAQIPAGGVSGAAAPAAAAAPASASAALPGEHMISGADLPEDLSP